MQRRRRCDELSGRIQWDCALLIKFLPELQARCLSIYIWVYQYFRPQRAKNEMCSPRYSLQVKRYALQKKKKLSQFSSFLETNYFSSFFFLFFSSRALMKAKWSISLEIFSLFWRHQAIDDDTWLESFVVQLQLSRWFFWQRPEAVGSAAEPSEQMVDDET